MRPRLLVALVSVVLVLPVLACQQEEPRGPRPSDDTADAYEPPPSEPLESASAVDQHAADAQQAWEDAKNATSDQERIDAANRALAAQQEMADAANQPQGEDPPNY